jgi:ribosomal protein S18 acetylase RimI-like enzyme
MAIPTRDLATEWRAEDAPRLARLFDAIGRAWPDGGWDPTTPEEAERHAREQEFLGCFVAEVGDRMVSICTVAAKPKERNRTYVGLLGADPDYHGRGLGKAVLLRAVERAYERGIARVDLHTWPGNLKAVPLYKKSGFMWSPEPGEWGAYMQNFTPGARCSPIAREFFAKHDWYRSLRRDLSLTPDEHKRGKARVYEYEWEEDGDRLRMVYDRQSWGLLEIETGDFMAGCSLEDEKLVAGLPQRITWRIVNHQKEPLEVVVVASGDEGVGLDHKDVVRVRDSVDLEAEFEIDPEIEDKEQEPRAAIVRTDLLINGEPITLEAGFQVRQAVHFALDGDGQGLRPGRPEPIVIQCRNELSRPARAEVRVTPSPGIELDVASTAIRLPARGSAELPVTLTASETGTALLKVEAEVTAGDRTVRPKKADLYASVLVAGEVVGHVEKEQVVLESAALRVDIHRREGWIQVTDKLRRRRIAGLGRPQVGPPFSWDEFFETPCRARVEWESGRVVAVLETPSVYREGLVLQRRIALSNLPLVAVTDSFLNGWRSRLDCRLRTGVDLNTRGGEVAAPAVEGIVRGLRSGAGRSLGEHRPIDKGEEWGERWFAAEDREGIAAGFLWQRAERVDSHGTGGGIELKMPPAAPGQSVSADPVYLFVGEGDHFTVRRWWQLLFGRREDREQRPEKTRRPLEFGIRPCPVVLHGRSAEVELAADSFGRLELAGALAVRTPQGLRVRPAKVDFVRARQSRKRAAKVKLTRAASTPEGGYFVDCSARIDRATYHERQPVIVLGDPRREVTAERTGDDGSLFRLSNGVLTMTVAPGFKGAAISLLRDGQELLRSAHPEARPLAFSNPWMGGIEPRLGGMNSGELYAERFTGREIERRGRQGITWRGVRVSCSPKAEPRREDRLALDYLLAPGSAIFAIAVRTTHRAGTAGWVDGGFEVWPVVGGSHLDAVLTSSGDPRASRLRCEYGGVVGGDRWIIAENPKTGDAAVVSCAGREANVGAEVFGRDGYFLTAGAGAVHEARQTRESVFFAAFTSSDRARDTAEALSQLRCLP